ncbi:hypothetical protein ACFOSC_00675 [Streptantibioticus rubrisoli]|uniref:Uncharacterized protein n=1 Tax=Streptantibioticus rubrisoli TaxID=1387313 RepID=A0ABT1PDB3_9ACTN|nr:hypothetical protein [Streptantibioticus rubrisoli]MCQ4043354.1 hypothetical protein [Streptantibioticus rubrisoli]
MKNEKRNPVDDRTAEQLLRCEAEDFVDGGELGTLSALLRAAGADDPSPAHGEDAAVAAFRTVRAGLRRPRRRRLTGSLRAGVAAAVAATLFGGVAVAAQTGALRLPFSSGHGPGPGVSAPASARTSTPPVPTGVPDGGGHASASVGAPTPSGRADPHDGAQSLRGLCTAYRASHRHQPGGMDRLIQAAGSEAAVAHYCATLLGSASDKGGHGGGKQGGRPSPTDGKGK